MYATFVSLRTTCTSKKSEAYIKYLDHAHNPYLTGLKRQRSGTSFDLYYSEGLSYMQAKNTGLSGSCSGAHFFIW